MIRQTLRPTTHNLTITIPDEYIDKELEFILFPLNTTETTKTNHTDTKKQNITNSLYGALKDININQDDYKNYLTHKHL